MSNHAMTRTPHRLLHAIMALTGCAVFMLMLLAGARPALAGVEVDNAIMLDPFDPVPEIQFNHFGGYAWGWGYGCNEGCGYRHCYHECGYNHCRRGCEARRPCEHDCGDGRDGCRDGCYDRGTRYDEQADRYDRQSCWYQHEYIGRDEHPCREGERDGRLDGRDGRDGHDGYRRVEERRDDGREGDGRNGEDGRHGDGHGDGHDGDDGRRGDGRDDGRHDDGHHDDGHHDDGHHDDGDDGH